MQAVQACVAFFTAASVSTSLAMSLLSVWIPASAPFCAALVKSCMIVAHLPIAACSAWGRSAGSDGWMSMPRALSAEPGGARKPYCSASAAPRYPQAPQGWEKARFAGPSWIPNGMSPAPTFG